MDITRRLRNRDGVPRHRRETILPSKAINNLMVLLHPSRDNGEHLLQVDNRATEHLHQISTVRPRRKVSISRRRLANMVLPHSKAVMGSHHHSNTALLHRNKDMALLRRNSTALLPASNTELPKVSALPLSLR